MAINDEWEYTRTQAELPYRVDAVCFRTGETHTRAAFYSRAIAESWAANDFAGHDWGIAVVRSEDDFVTWTSF